MALGTALGSVLGIKPKTRPKSDVGGSSGASHIPVRNPPKESQHFQGLGPSEPLVMAPKQANTNMQPTLGVYPGNGGSSTRSAQTNTRAQGLPVGMPADLGMSAGPYAQPAVDPNMMMGMMGAGGGGMGQQGPPAPTGGLGPSIDPLMKRRMMTARPGSF